MGELKSYYHSAIIYPGDFIRKYIGSMTDWETLLDDLSLNLDCDYMLSPLHTPQNEKVHRHILFRNPNKITGNSFQAKLCDALNGDFRGVAYSPSTCCINKVDRHIRYFIHYDNPNKQQFTRSELSYIGNWDAELYSAFGEDILEDMTDLISSGVCVSIQDLCNIYGFGYALRKGHNMYFINSLLNEKRKEIQK